MQADKVREFWDIQAEVHGQDGRATAPDHFYRDMEINRIIDHLGEEETVLDVGCGNGYSTFKFAEARPKCAWNGIDYSKEMITQARKTRDLKYGDIYAPLFAQADIRKSLDYPNSTFDTIISERCLINLANWGEQQQALLNMKKVLKPKGKIILVENVIDGLKRLNGLRQSYGLPDIEVRWHNQYLPQKELVDFCSKHFNIEHYANIGGMYYVISRVIYAAMAKKSGEEISYDHPINEMASKLPHIACPYSPNYLFVLRNRP